MDESWKDIINYFGLFLTSISVFTLYSEPLSGIYKDIFLWISGCAWMTFLVLMIITIIEKINKVKK